MRSEQLPEEPFSRLGVSPRLQVHIDDVAVLIDYPAPVMTLTRNRDEYFVDEERVAESRVFALESLRKQWPELVAPQPDRLVAHLDSPLGEQVLNVAVAEIETMVEPDRVLNDGGREPVPLADTGGRLGHTEMIAQSRLT